ncbi:hypothetical protein ACIREO_11050 [Streptomyces sp. NPDC102441]|uniref:hypothetical protein n=1 Tax=Streptomyces sp. NPDC102441 TaxID=3366176 RepID=UPI00382F80C5
MAALALFLGQVPLRRAFRSGADQAAAGWNQALASAPLPGPDELRAELAKARIAWDRGEGREGRG